jgi:hypothetical protein
MPRYTAGVAGPISLSDGRVVTAEQGPFELDVTTPHDEDLVERGVIVAAAEASDPDASTPAPSAPATSAPASAPVPSTPPAAGATSKAGE